jgi:hypothetical protein
MNFFLTNKKTLIFFYDIKKTHIFKNTAFFFWQFKNTDLFSTILRSFYASQPFYTLFFAFSFPLENLRTHIQQLCFGKKLSFNKVKTTYSTKVWCNFKWAGELSYITMILYRVRLNLTYFLTYENSLCCWS